MPTITRMTHLPATRAICNAPRRTLGFRASVCAWANHFLSSRRHKRIVIGGTCPSQAFSSSQITDARPEARRDILLVPSISQDARR